MSNYNKLLEDINEATKESGRNSDIWLTEATANKVLAEADTVKIEEDNLVLGFTDGTSISITHESHLICGDKEDVYWIVVHAGDYRRFPYGNTSERCLKIL